MKKIIRLTESDLKLIIKRVINEDNVFGNIARKALSWAGKNEDDIANLFRTSEKVLAQSIDDIVGNAMKSKSISNLDDIQMKLMHYYNPSAIAENIPKAQQQMKNFLNGYSKSKGKSNWGQIRNEVTGTPQPKAASASSQAVRDIMKGQRVSNRWYGFTDPNYSKYIDWHLVTNAKNMNDYNKVIAQAIKTGDYSYISSKGFEKFGIPNFRDYLKNNIAKVNEVDPSTGRWSVVFK